MLAQADAQLAIGRPWPEYAIIALMLIAAGLMFRRSAQVSIARSLHRTSDSPILWSVCGLIFLLFSLVKGLNLLAFVGVWLRELTRAEGMYDGRRPLQLLAVSLVGMLAFIGIAAMLSHRDLVSRHRMLLTCMGILALFGMTRFISLHDIDAVLRNHAWIRPAVEIPLVLIACSQALSTRWHEDGRRRRSAHRASSIASDTSATQ